MRLKYHDIVNNKLAPHNLTIDDLSDEELEVLLYGIRDDIKIHRRRVNPDGLSPTTIRHISQRKSLMERGENIPICYKNLASVEYLEIAKNMIASYDLTFKDLSKEELADLLRDIRDDILNPSSIKFDGFYNDSIEQISYRKM